jgi:hypothetical protein
MPLAEQEPLRVGADADGGRREDEPDGDRRERVEDLAAGDRARREPRRRDEQAGHGRGVLEQHHPRHRVAHLVDEAPK